VKIIGTLETIETGAIEQTESECSDYRQIFDAILRMLPEGVGLPSVRVER